MKSQLFKRSLISGKMKLIRLLATLLFVLLTGFANGASVVIGVTFGNPQSGGGACVGKGVCKTSLSSDALSNYVGVTFLVNAANPNVLIMRFSKSELLRKQPEQVSYFSDPNGYSFDSQYPVTDAVYAPLNLLPNAAIQPGIQYVTQVTGDIISVYITFSNGSGN